MTDQKPEQTTRDIPPMGAENERVVLPRPGATQLPPGEEDPQAPIVPEPAPDA